MTPKEKAEDLVDSFKEHSKTSIDEKISKEFNLKNIEYTNSKFVAMMRWSRKYHSKRCALKCVDEILDSSMGYFDDNSDYVNYWQQVKKEIVKTE